MSTVKSPIIRLIWAVGHLIRGDRDKPSPLAAQCSSGAGACQKPLPGCE